MLVHDQYFMPYFCCQFPIDLAYFGIHVLHFWDNILSFWLSLLHFASEVFNAWFWTGIKILTQDFNMCWMLVAWTSHSWRWESRKVTLWLLERCVELYILSLATSPPSQWCITLVALHDILKLSLSLSLSPSLSLSLTHTETCMCMFSLWF